LLPQLALFIFLPEQQRLFLKLLAPALTAVLAVKTVAVVAHMQNQVQQLGLLPAEQVMQTYLRVLRMDQLRIVG
jgi:hypothetical protein